MRKFLSTLCIIFTFALNSQTIVKGPYLQIGTQNSMMIRWETNVACNSKVAYGTSTAALTSNVTSTLSVTSHTIQINSLTPYTKYYYNIGTTSTVLQGDTNNYFLTSPVPGTPGKYRFWVVGDCGNNSTNQTNCKNQFKTFNGNRITNGWLLVGDNAYNGGLNTEFNTNFFNIYQTDVMKKMVLWPAPGNHDYNNSAAIQASHVMPYYDIFSLPTAGEAGGVASGTKAYYSYDYGNIHFLSLDSYGLESSTYRLYDTLGPQAIWVKNDLAANTKKWVVAYWHHPPYTMGSHNSDTESELINMRTNFIRILERYGVDLILCGHSHDYERSKLLKGHYGNAASFNAAIHNLSSSSALYNGSANSCPYIKDSLTKKYGTVYVVSGSAGQLGGTQASFPHAAMYYSNATNGGSLVLDFDNNRLDAQWVCADGVVRDKFTIFKNVDKVKTFTVTPTQTTNISASWPGTYAWSNSATTNSINVTTSVNATYWVKDPNNCVADTFKFVVSGSTPASNFSYSGTHCAGLPISFTDMSTNSPASWLWSASPSIGVTITTATSQNPSITFNNSGTYSVTLVPTNSFGPGAPVTKTLTVNPLPTLSANTSNSLICSGQSVTITASGASTYSWNTSATASAIVVSPSITTTYSVIGTSASSCSNTTAFTQSVSACTGLQQIVLGNSSINIYPNPNSGNFNVDLSGLKNLDIEIYNEINQLVFSGKLKEGFNKIELNTKSGIYFYNIMDKAKLVNKGKLIVQ